jgi:hypothetical protein
MAIRRDAVMGDPTVNFVAALDFATAPTGNVLGFGFVTQFTVRPIPEPSTLVLAVLGGVGLSATRKRWRQV